MLRGGGSAQCAEINQANNTQIIRRVVNGDGCDILPAFFSFFPSYIGGNNPPPTACTAFIIAPLRYPTNGTVFPPPAQSSVNLPTLIQAAKVEKVRLLLYYLLRKGMHSLL